MNIHRFLLLLPLAAALTSSEQMATAIAGLHALQRLGEPDDIAAAAAFLLSPMGRGITGEILHVDAGYHVVGMKNPAAPDISVVGKD